MYSAYMILIHGVNQFEVGDIREMKQKVGGVEAYLETVHPTGS